MVTFVCWGIPQFFNFWLPTFGRAARCQILRPDVKISFFHRPQKKNKPWNLNIGWFVYFLVGGNSNIFGIFTPKIGEDEPISTVAYFSKGLVKNHQPVFVDVFFS